MTINHPNLHARSAVAEQQLRDLLWLGGLNSFTAETPYRDRVPKVRLRDGRAVPAPDLLVLGRDGHHAIEVKARKPLRMGGYALDEFHAGNAVDLSRHLCPTTLAFTALELNERSAADFVQRSAVELEALLALGDVERVTGAAGPFLRVPLVALHPLAELVERLGGDPAGLRLYGR